MSLDLDALILVAVLPHPRDFELARLLGWYRIPLRRAPKVVAVDYLAFYQPSTFGERGGRVEWIAPVLGQELVTRAVLLQAEQEHPRAGEEYFKLQLGPLEALPQPILAERWKRLSFLYTTGEYLLQARTLNDLVVRTEERRMLWQALRERVGQEYVAELPVEVGAGLLAELLGILQGTEGAEGAEEAEGTEGSEGTEGAKGTGGAEYPKDSEDS